MDLTISGLEITLIGMVMVFLFLVVLIYAMKLMSYFVNKYHKVHPEKVQETRLERAVENNEDIAIVIAAAVSMSKK